MRKWVAAGEKDKYCADCHCRLRRSKTWKRLELRWSLFLKDHIPGSKKLKEWLETEAMKMWDIRLPTPHIQRLVWRCKSGRETSQSRKICNLDVEGHLQRPKATTVETQQPEGGGKRRQDRAVQCSGKGRLGQTHSCPCSRSPGGSARVSRPSHLLFR